ELGRFMTEALTQPQHVDDAVQPSRVGFGAGDGGGEGDVLFCGEGGQEVELLEDEADLVAAEFGEGFVAQAGDGGVADGDGAAVGGVESGQAVHERRLARARGAHDGGELAGVELDGDVAERDDLRLTDTIGLPEALGGDGGCLYRGCGGHDALSFDDGVPEDEVK